MEICDKIERLIAPSLTDMGYEVVRVLLQGGDIKTLQVMAERIDRVDMTVDDCESISHTVSALLDVDDPFAGRYTLEVSSPGLDRPLVKPADYNRFKGLEAKIETVRDINGRKRFKGRILKLDETTNTVYFQFENQEMQFPFTDIAKAKLLLTDELLRQHQNKN